MSVVQVDLRKSVTDFLTEQEREDRLLVLDGSCRLQPLSLCVAGILVKGGKVYLFAVCRDFSP